MCACVYARCPPAAILLLCQGTTASLRFSPDATFSLSYIVYVVVLTRNVFWHFLLTVIINNMMSKLIPLWIATSGLISWSFLRSNMAIHNLLLLFTYYFDHSVFLVHFTLCLLWPFHVPTHATLTTLKALPFSRRIFVLSHTSTSKSDFYHDYKGDASCVKLSLQ